MPFYIPRGPGAHFRTLQQTFARGDGEPFASALTEEQIRQAATAEGVAFGAGPNCIFTPFITLWAWVIQAASGSTSCVAAVARVIVLQAAMGLDPCAAARALIARRARKLPEGFLRRLTYQVGVEVEDQAPAHWRWHNRARCSSMALKLSPTILRPIKRPILNRPVNSKAWASR